MKYKQASSVLLKEWELDRVGEFVARIDEEGADVTESAWRLYYDVDSEGMVREMGDFRDDDRSSPLPVPAAAASSYASLLHVIERGQYEEVAQWAYKLYLSLSSRGRMYHEKNYGEAMKLWR